MYHIGPDYHVGRFDRLLYVGPPSEIDRVDVFRVHLRTKPCSPDVDIKELAHLTEGCSGADILSICREAAISALEVCCFLTLVHIVSNHIFQGILYLLWNQEDLGASEIKMEHLKNAIENVRPSEMQPYEELSEKFQRLVCSKAQSDDLVCQPQLSPSKGITSW